MSDRLVDAIRADPESDDARLVWADREGGDRGELVVVQCALARMRVTGERSRDAMRRLFERERELLVKSWKWPGFRSPSRRVERGFLVRRAVTFGDITNASAQARLFETAPLLREIFLEGARVVVPDSAPTPDWSPADAAIVAAFDLFPPGRITHVEACPEIVVESDGGPSTSLEQGRELLATLAKTRSGRVLRGLGVQATVDLESLTPFRDASHLDLRIEFPARLLGDLLATHPRITSLRLRGSPAHVRGRELAALLAHPLAAQLTALDLSYNELDDDDVRTIGSSPRLARLERLAVPYAHITPSGFAAITESQHLARLEELDIHGNVYRDELLPPLARATFASRLRVLRASAINVSTIAHFLTFPALERLYLGQGIDPTGRFHALDQVIPFVQR